MKQNQIWLSGRVVYGASLRHWSLRRRGFKSRLSQNIECISFWMDETLTDRAGCPLKCSLVPFLLTRCRWNAHPQPPEQRRTSMSIAPSSHLDMMMTSPLPLSSWFNRATSVHVHRSSSTHSRHFDSHNCHSLSPSDRERHPPP